MSGNLAKLELRMKCSPAISQREGNNAPRNAKEARRERMAYKIFRYKWKSREGKHGFSIAAGLRAYPLLMESRRALGSCFNVRLIGKPLRTFPDAL